MTPDLQVTLGQSGFAVRDKETGEYLADGYDSPEEAIEAAKEGRLRAVNMAAALDHFEQTLDEEPMLEAENAILDLLGVSGDETEQGLTEAAVAAIEAFQKSHGQRGYAQTTPSGPAVRSAKAALEESDGPEPDGTRYLGGGLYGSTSR